ncbi:hypothetical protein V6N13_104314 [Hibiscus sabdariffa]
MDRTTEDVLTSSEAWMKVLAIEDKINIVTSTMGRVATTVQTLDIAHKLFYAYVKTWHKSTLTEMSKITLVSLLEFVGFEFEEIIKEDKLDANCEEHKLMKDFARLVEVVTESDEQKDNPLAILVYKALPQLIPTAGITDDVNKEEEPENEKEID